MLFSWLCLAFLFATTAESVQIRSLFVDASIDGHYAKTLVTSELVNNNDTAPAEARFSFQLPETAFVSGFNVRVGSRTYYGVVIEATAAQREYEEQVDRGNNAATLARGMSAFTIFINLRPNTPALFELRYEQLLTRRLGLYEYDLNISPGSVVSSVNVSIVINSDVGFYDVQAPSTPSAVVTQLSATRYSVAWTPPASSTVDANLVVQYRVPDTTGAGRLLINAPFFIHMFVPPADLPVLPKELVLVIDISGSMAGTKLAQAKTAMAGIVQQLSGSDRFSIVTFESAVAAWHSSLVGVESKSAAVAYINGLQALGSTNLNGGMGTALQILANGHSAGFVPMIVLLTDGQPTQGVTDPSTIRANIRNANTAALNASIFCLGFGFDLNFDLLRQISLENRGFEERIYEADDAAEQVAAFFQQISTPLLSDITMQYPPTDSTSNLTATTFPYAFAGSELLVAGMLRGAPAELTGKVSAQSGSSAVQWLSTVFLSNATVLSTSEEIWAYLSIQQLLDQMEISNSSDASAHALALSLDYQLVTPVTGLIVYMNDTEATNGTTSTTRGPQQQSSAAPVGVGGVSSGGMMPVTGVTYANLDSSDATRISGRCDCLVLALILVLLSSHFCN